MKQLRTIFKVIYNVLKCFWQTLVENLVIRIIVTGPLSIFFYLLTVVYQGREVRILLTFRSSRPEMFCKKGVFRNFAKFTGKHMCQTFFFNKLAGVNDDTNRFFGECFSPINYQLLPTLVDKFIRRTISMSKNLMNSSSLLESSESILKSTFGESHFSKQLFRECFQLLTCLHSSPNLFHTKVRSLQRS